MNEANEGESLTWCLVVPTKEEISFAECLDTLYDGAW